MRPHPADFMTDAQYEEYRRAMESSGPSVDVDMLNYEIDVESELLVEHFSGYFEDFSEEAKDVLLSNGWTPEEVDLHRGGEWLVAVDGEVHSFDEFCPARVHVRE